MVRGRKFFTCDNVDWSYLTSYKSIAVTCINKFATLPHDYSSLYDNQNGGIIARLSVITYSSYKYKN